MADELPNIKVLDKLTKTLLPVVGSLSGLGAVFTGIGYLAERSHLAMLGFTSVPVDLNQYLYTGLKLVALLPAILIANAAAALEPLWIGLIVFAFGLVVWRWLLQSKRFPSFNDFHVRVVKTIPGKVRNIVGRLRSLLLALLILAQLIALLWLTNVATIRNLIYDYKSEVADDYKSEIAESTSNPFAILLDAITPVSTNKLKYSILNEKQEFLSGYFFKLFCIALVMFVILRTVMATYQKGKFKNPLVGGTVLLGINLLIFLTQLIFLPINFGALLLSKEYPQIQLKFSKSESPKVNITENKRLVDANDLAAKTDSQQNGVTTNRPPVVENPIRSQTMSTKDREGFRRDLTKSPIIFSDPDGDSLTYEIGSIDPDTLVNADVNGNWLEVYLNKTKIDTTSIGEFATIKVTATDTNGEMTFAEFTVTVDSMDNSPPVPKTNQPIADRTLLSGWPPFTIDLAKERIFSDKNKSRLSKLREELSNLKESLDELKGHGQNEKTIKQIRSGKEQIKETKKQIGSVKQQIEETKKMAEKAEREGDYNKAAELRYGTNDKLYYMASSSNPDAVSIMISGSTLSVTPNSAGNTTVFVVANDEKGRNTQIQFEVGVITWQQLEDELLTLLHRTDSELFIYSPKLKKIINIKSGDISSIVYLGLANLF